MGAALDRINRIYRIVVWLGRAPSRPLYLTQRRRDEERLLKKQVLQVFRREQSLEREAGFFNKKLLRVLKGSLANTNRR